MFEINIQSLRHGDWANKLLPVKEKSHALAEMNCTSSNYGQMEYLVAAPEVVKLLGKPPLWDSEDINECSTDVNGASKSPRLNPSSGVYVPFVPIVL